MKKLLFFLSILGYGVAAFGQTGLFIGEKPLDEISAPYIIVNPYVNPLFISLTVDYGQDCREYRGAFQAKQLRTKCNGFNDESGAPAEIYSLAHMMNIFAQRGYELDRILPGTDPDDPFDQWDAQYVFCKRIN